MKRSSQLKRIGFKTKKRIPLKRTKLRVVGKIGKANLEANKILKEKLAHITYCEIRGKFCMGGMFLTNAHRHKRSWYKGDVDLLSDLKQVVRVCVKCHETIEHDKELTEETFMELRGDE